MHLINNLLVHNVCTSINCTDNPIPEEDCQHPEQREIEETHSFLARIDSPVRCCILENERIGQSLDVKKTEYMVIAKKSSNPKYNRASKGDQFKQVTKFKYLGYLIKSLERRIRNFQLLGFSIFCRLYDTLVVVFTLGGDGGTVASEATPRSAGILLFRVQFRVRSRPPLQMRA
ncbi:hypothetical protein PoB_004544500 [Plakobranchus ocellatus]|uniref:Uncharacterized protein n=1 Tax=Plakobranchus ocellatus TaxID=259542 RepID=A0AAV4BEE2_9GAST|nr:hypothetical protein PoB_004544500 [Plakobranchus ocellatus]